MSAFREQTTRALLACVTITNNHDSGGAMIIHPGKHRPQGPWDPDAKKKYFDTSEAWLWLPLLAVVGAVVAATYFFN